MEQRKDVNPKSGAKKYGDVAFADEKNKKYPIDTEEHIRAAWTYINKAKNAAKYSAADVAAIKAKIVAAWKATIDKAGPPSVAQAEIPDTMSLGDLYYEICEALDEKFLTPDGMCARYSIQEIYPDRVIVSDMDGGLWQLPYTITGEDVTIGDPASVEIEYVPSAGEQPEAATTQQAGLRIFQAVDKQGWEWAVVVIAPGLGANAQYFPAETLQSSVSVFEGARVFCLDESQHSATRDKSAKQIVGWIDQARYVAGSGIVGRLHLMPTADWLRQNLLASHGAGKPDLYGLSVDAPGQAIMRQVKELGNKMVQWFTKITSPATVDVVWNPGTPGGFQRALNAVSVHATTEEEEEMKKLLAILQAKRPDLLVGVDQAAITEEQALALLDKAMTTPAPASVAQASGMSDDDKAQIQQAKRLNWNAQVTQAMADCKLPAAMQDKLRKRFMDNPGDIAHVAQAIKDDQEVLASLSQSGQVQGLGQVHDIAVEGEAERMQASMDKLFGVESKIDAPKFVSLRQAYVAITGDVDMNGRPPAHAVKRAERMTQAMQAYWRKGIDAVPGQEAPGFVRIEQSQIATAWPTILGNTMYRRLMMDYAAVDYGESMVISNRRRAVDFRTLEAQRLAYSADLPTVNAEAADYTEAASLGEEQVNYVVSTRGRIMTVTRKVLLNDDLGAVIKLPQREGRAARRTFARSVWALAMSNANYDADATAWFHANHANLGSVALTADGTGVTEMLAALNRLMAQTEPGSAETLRGAYWKHKIMLAVPQALAGKAKQLNQSKGIPGAANQGDNPIYGVFGAEDNPERIVVCPLFTDATDWYLFMDPAESEIIEVAFLNGQETPEVFLADQQNVGQMFLADKIQYKIRFEYGAEILDFRTAQKNVVAG